MLIYNIILISYNLYKCYYSLYTIKLFVSIDINIIIKLYTIYSNTFNI